MYLESKSAKIEKERMVVCGARPKFSVKDSAGHWTNNDASCRHQPLDICQRIHPEILKGTAYMTLPLGRISRL